MDNEKQQPQATEEAAPISKERIASTLLDVLESFVLAAMAVLILFTCAFRVSIVKGQSMEDTLFEGDVILLHDVFYTPKYGDIVVIHQPTPHYPDPLVKRIIAVGGQTVDIDFSTWEVTVDGVVLEEDYMKLETDRRITSDYTFPMTIPEGYVFVMGDNRNHSADSRSSDIGLIDERSILGKFIWRVCRIPIPSAEEE